MSLEELDRVAINVMAIMDANNAGDAEKAWHLLLATTRDSAQRAFARRDPLPPKFDENEALYRRRLIMANYCECMHGQFLIEPDVSCT